MANTNDLLPRHEPALLSAAGTELLPALSRGMGIICREDRGNEFKRDETEALMIGREPIPVTA